MPPPGLRLCADFDSPGADDRGADSNSRAPDDDLLPGDADEVLPVDGGAAAGGDVRGASGDTDADGGGWW